MNAPLQAGLTGRAPAPPEKPFLFTLARSSLPTLLLFGCALIQHVYAAVYSWETPIWHPRNELAHYDFIDSLSKGHWPKPGASISDETFNLTLAHFQWKSPDDFDGTKEGMGVEGLSYENHQPPVYYAVMAVPNALLRIANVAPATRVRLLRLFQNGVVGLGLLLVFPIFSSLHRSLGISRVAGGLIACWMATTNCVRYASLGNDSFAVFACNLVFLFCALWFEKKQTFWAVAAALTTSLAMLVKFTNGLVLPVYAATWFTLLIGARRRPGKKDIFLLLLPLLPVLLYMGFNMFACGEPMRTSATKDSFEHLIPGIAGTPEFVHRLMNDAFCLTQFHILFPPWGLLLAVACLSASVLLSIYRIVTNRDRKASLLLLGCCLLVAGLLAAAALLNHFRPGVRWEAFRHYAGVQLACWWALLGGIWGCFGREKIGGNP